MQPPYFETHNIDEEWMDGHKEWTLGGFIYSNSLLENLTLRAYF